MEEKFPDWLFKDTEDINSLKKGRDYLNTNTLEENPNIIRRSSELISSILAVCSSQNTPEDDALKILLDEFHNLCGSINLDIRNIFGYEPGFVCAKNLPVTERMKTFEVQFSKLMAVVNEISKYNSDVWRATARQILNIFINKKFSPGYLETILKRYAVTLSNIDVHILHNFSLDNLSLLKTLSLLVQQVGDFETQFAIMRVVFAHLSNNLKLMEDFFALSKKERILFQSLKFDDFDRDCRLFLNAVNKHQVGGFRGKVYSISCHVLHFRGCLVNPPMNENVIWVDANEETERLSIKCGSFDSEHQNVMYLMFSEIAHVLIDKGGTEANSCVRIWLNTIRYCDVKNNDIYLVADSKKDVFDFVSFLESKIQKRKEKLSKPESLFIGRNLTNAISPVLSEIHTIVPGKINPFGKSDEENTIPQTQAETPHLMSQDQNIVLETQDSHSFWEISEAKPFEDMTKTQSEMHLFMNSKKKFFQETRFCFEFSKENQPPYNKNSNPSKNKKCKRRISTGLKLQETTSQDYFRQNVQNKKPSLPKLRKKKSQAKEENKEKRHRKNEYKPLPIKETVEHSKPFLLNPNGHKCSRWMKPTTSERSNFWVRKLDEQKKQKADVYEFTDSDSEEIKKTKRRFVSSKRKYNKKTSLKQAATVSKNIKKPSTGIKKPTLVASPKPDELYEVPFNSPVLLQPSPKCDESALSGIINRCFSTSESSIKVELPDIDKRDLSEEEEHSPTTIYKNEKMKTKLPKTLFPATRRRLQKADDKAVLEANKIIATINNAVTQLLNHSQREPYLGMTEIVSTELEADIRHLNLRVRRLQRILLYIKTWCSVSEIYQSMKNHLRKIKDSFKNMNFGEDQLRID